MRVATLAVLCGCNAVFGVGDTVLVNGNPRALVFDNSASARDLVDFPVLVALDPTRIDYATIADPATDLRFHDPVTDQDLAFEIERWDPSARSDIWVRVPLIAARSTTGHILMYFGRDAHGVESPADVWVGHELVLHGKPGNFDNAAGASYAGTGIGVGVADGPIASAMTFLHSGEHRVTFANGVALLQGWPQFSIELWLYADYPSANLAGAEPRLLDRAPSVANGRLYQSPNIDFLLTLQIDVHYASGFSSYLSAFVPLQTWVHVVYTYDGQTLWIHRNGTFANVQRLLQGSPLESETQGSLILGGIDVGFNGMLDEVRVTKTYHDPDWVNAQYLAMTGKLVTFQNPGDEL